MVPTVVVPVMTLGNCVFLPQQLMPLRIFEPRYRKMLKETLAGSRMFAISQLDEESLTPDNDEPPCPFTCVGRIVGHVELEDGTSHIILEGLRRAKVIKVKRKTPYPQLEIAPVVDEASTDLAGSRMFAISQLDEDSLTPDNDEPPCPFTCVGRIVGHVELEDGTSHIILEGLRRAKVIKVKRKTPYPQLEIAPVVDEASTDLIGSTRDIARVLAFAENIVSELGEEAAPMMQRLRGLANQPGALADAAAGHLVADAATRRQLLECLSQDQRIKAVADELARLDAQRKLDEQGGGEDARGLN